MDKLSNDILEAVYEVILERKRTPSSESYTSSLYRKGLDKVLGKIGEESAELIIAGKGGKREEVVYETADLLFHTLVLLGCYEIPPSEIYEELRRRFGTSGIAEKRSRKQ